MLLTQQALDDVIVMFDFAEEENSSLPIGEKSRILHRETYPWTARAQAARILLSSLNAEKIILEIDQVLISELNVSRLTEQFASTDSTTISELRAIPFYLPSLPDTASELQTRLISKWPAVMARARELEQRFPDPVQAMIDLLGNLPGDYDTWREILEEPYG